MYDDILFREVRPSDFEMLKAFLEWNDVPEITRYFHPFPLTAETAKWIATKPKSDRYYLAFLKGQVVGMSMLRGWDEGFSVPSFGILVDRKFHGKGIGRLMTERTIEGAKKLGCKQVRLSVYASNVSAYHLYTSLEFREISRKSVEIQGEKDEKIVMIKDL